MKHRCLFFLVSLLFILSCQSVRHKIDYTEEPDEQIAGMLAHPVLLPNTSKRIARAVEQIYSQGSIEQNTLKRLKKSTISAPIARYGFKLIHLAALYERNPETLFYLISNDIDPFAPETLYNASPLHLAAWRNKNPEILQTLLDNGHPADTRDAFGRSPLHWAVIRNNEAPIVSRLITSGFDPYILDQDQNSLLHLAITHNENPLPIVSVLLEAGVSPNAFNKEGVQALHLVPRFATNTPDLVDTLVAYGALINGQSLYLQETPLHIAAEIATLELVERLVTLGADPGITNVNSYTAVHKAAWGNPDPAVMSYVISLYQSPNVREPVFNATPLHLAAWNNTNPSILGVLVASGAMLDAQDITGETPLHVALMQSINPLIFADTLLSLGANPFIPNKQNITAAKIIEENPRLQFLNFTLQSLQRKNS